LQGVSDEIVRAAQRSFAKPVSWGGQNRVDYEFTHAIVAATPRDGASVFSTLYHSSASRTYLPSCDKRRVP
jgi:hypothetical protein